MNCPRFTTRRPLQEWLLIAVCMLFAGCALTVSQPKALLSIESFVPLASDPRIKVEPGFEAYGERAGQALPQAVAQAEAQVDDGLSVVYTFFDPTRESDSLGVYGVLWQIELAKRLELPYLYLGYWIKSSRKMAYKKLYPPLEGLSDGHWQLIARE